MPWHSQYRKTRKIHATERPLVAPELEREPATTSGRVVHGTVNEENELASPVTLRCMSLQSGSQGNVDELGMMSPEHHSRSSPQNTMSIKASMYVLERSTPFSLYGSRSR
jgi:hypothetical protein